MSGACRKIVKVGGLGGGGNISDYVVICYTSGGSGGT